MHMVIIATFSVAETGVPVVTELSLVPVTQQWLPVEYAFDEQLVDRLVNQGRTFKKCLRYNLPQTNPVPNAILSDVGADTCSLRIAFKAEMKIETMGQNEADNRSHQLRNWAWHPENGAMPPLPTKRLLKETATSEQCRLNRGQQNTDKL